MIDGDQLINLKPCPFCGSLAGMYGRKYRKVKCFECGAVASNVAAWNSRPVENVSILQSRRLKALVQSAYREGWEDALDCSILEGSRASIELEWPSSVAYAALVEDGLKYEQL